MVAIKDFGMPSCCMNCEMQIDGLSAGYYCAITEEELNDNIILKHRHPNCPLVEIEERKAGEWEDMHDKEEWYGDQFKCSVCGWVTLDNGKYCPNCGAEMRGAENE